MVKEHVRFLNATIAAVAAAALLTFCSPAPAHAQGKGTFLPCAQLAKDAGILTKAVKLGVKEVKVPDTPYMGAVTMLAENALSSADPAAWLKLWKASCLRGQA